jgi:general stress protein 26
MKEQDPLRVFRALLDSVRVGVLCTLSKEGYPHSRWMTATTLPRVQDCFYCVSTAGSPKVCELEACDKVQWSFQSPTLGEIVTLRGRAAVLNNPGLKAEVLEALGPNLSNFWRINPDPAKLVVIETVIEKSKLFRPMERLNAKKEAPS